ncbi:MAG: hypothetical protein OEY99_02620 [Aigarchaeota archaeon]|nr:hypothetical protein [Aigarchaeota archaeon]
MRPPCEVIARYILPAFRSLVAKELVEKHKLSQVAAASMLGTTQAAVSQYIYSKRGDRTMGELEAISGVRSTVRRIAREMARGKSSHLEGTSGFCTFCRSIREQELICRLHQQHTSIPKNCDMCLAT